MEFNDEILKVTKNTLVETLDKNKTRTKLRNNFKLSVAKANMYIKKVLSDIENGLLTKQQLKGLITHKLLQQYDVSNALNEPQNAIKALVEIAKLNNLYEDPNTIDVEPITVLLNEAN